MSAETLSIISLLVSLTVLLAVPFSIFLGRTWLTARITKGIEHRFNEKLEQTRADFRASEARLVSELRDKEAAINALRTNVLSGAASRQALVDKRRLDAVDRVWATVIDLGPYKGVSGAMAVLNLKNISKKAHEPKMQQFLRAFAPNAPNPLEFKSQALNERPYIPELAWAYFHAYQSILIAAAARLHTLRTGLEDPDQYMTWDGIKGILKATLPHHAKWIDENEPQTFYYLVDELETLLLAELRKVLDGKEADAASVSRAHEISEAVEKGRQRQTEENLKNLPSSGSS